MTKARGIATVSIFVVGTPSYGRRLSTQGNLRNHAYYTRKFKESYYTNSLLF